MSPEMVVIDGPLAPDLFGGETPMQAAVPVSEAAKAYSVTLSMGMGNRVGKRVIARSEKEAAELAIKMTDCGEFDEEYLEVDGIIESGLRATRAEISQYLKERERGH